MNFQDSWIFLSSFLKGLFLFCHFWCFVIFQWKYKTSFRFLIVFCGSLQDIFVKRIIRQLFISIWFQCHVTWQRLLNRKTWTRHSHYLPSFINSNLWANFPYPSCMSYFSSNTYKKKLSQQLIFFTQVWATLGSQKKVLSIILSFLNNLGASKRYTNEIIHESLKTTCLEWLRRKKKGKRPQKFPCIGFWFLFFSWKLQNFSLNSKWSNLFFSTDAYWNSISIARANLIFFIHISSSKNHTLPKSE